MRKSNIVYPDLGPAQLPLRPMPPFADIAIACCVVFSSILLFLALPNIISGSDLWSYAKALVLSLSAGVVAYSVNRVAIERGAPQAAKGYVGAMIVSLAAILAVGLGLFTASYAGLVFKDVESKLLQQHGSVLAVWVGERVEDAAEASRAVPAVRASVDDLTGKRDCEFASSCVSGRGDGGKGPVWRALDTLAGRALALQSQLIAGEAVRANALDALDQAIAAYQRILADDSRSIWDRRGELQTLDARVRQLAAELSEATPLALISAYADELNAEIVIPDRPEATAALTAITRKHASALSSVIGSIEGSTSALPAFPARAGVGDTLTFIGHFIPVAAIAAVVEVVFPGALWLFTYWNLRWEIFQRETAAAAAAVPATGPLRKRDGNSGSAAATPRLITHLKPSSPPEDANARAGISPRRKRASVRRSATRS